MRSERFVTAAPCYHKNKNKYITIISNFCTAKAWVNGLTSLKKNKAIINRLKRFVIFLWGTGTGVKNSWMTHTSSFTIFLRGEKKQVFKNLTALKIHILWFSYIKQKAVTSCMIVNLKQIQTYIVFPVKNIKNESRKLLIYSTYKVTFLLQNIHMFWWTIFMKQLHSILSIKAIYKVCTN